MTNIIVESIRLRNFGAVKEATLKPLQDGLTGIAGVSGAGKTTFLKGMQFALFNVTPDNVKIGNLRRLGSDYKSDECSVSVVFRHEGQRIEVIRELTGKNNKNIPSIYVDGKEEVWTSSKTAENWVKKRLGMDAKDFTTATVIPQKQLDEIVDALPSVRRARIEKLAGIESMSTAVENARKEENAIRTQVKAMPGSVEIVEALEIEVETHIDVLKEASDKEYGIGQYLAQIEQEYLQAKTQYDELVAQNTLYQQKQNSVKNLEGKVANLQGNYSLVSTQLDSVNERFVDGNLEAGENLEAELSTHEATIESLSEKVRVFKVAVSSLEQKISYESQALSQKENELKSVESTIAAIESNAVSVTEDEISEAESKVSSVQDEISKAQAKKAQLSTEWTETADSIKLLSANSHDAECPTCHSHLADPSGLIKSLENALTRIREEGTRVSSDIERYTSLLGDARNELNQLKQNQRTYLNALSAVENHRQGLAGIKKDIAKLRDSVKTYTTELEETYLFDADEVQYALEDASEAKNGVLRRLEAVKHIEQAKREKEALEGKLAEIDANIVAAKQELNEALDELKNLPEVDEEEVSILSSTIDSAAHIIRTKREERNELAISISTEKVRLENARANLAKEKATVASKLSLLTELEHKAAVSDVLDEFRKSSIAKIAPELAESATELISAMTNGKFVQVHMDSEFTPSVTNSDGHILTIHQLSGGELSVVALALRISIGNLISGGTGGMLWLDEVLSAQDIDRRHAILQAIRALPVNQIVMINHTQEAEDVVDKVVRMTYSADEGSFIEANDEE